MLMLNEFKKNIGFFLLMALVLMLLMSAGVSIFNFSFELSKEINKEISGHFEFGYDLDIEEYINPVDKKMPGVDYYTYPTNGKVFYPLPEGFPYDGEEDADEEIEREYPVDISPNSYYLEDYLPKNFLRAKEETNNFIISGRLWEKSDNDKTDEKYPIFLSDYIVNYATKAGKELELGDEIRLGELRYDEHNDLIENEVLTFIIKGIYQYENLDFEYQKKLPLAVIPLSAELEYRTALGEEILWSYAKINNLRSFKEFITYAKKNKITYLSFLEDDIQLISLFTSIFTVVSVAVLTLSGFIAFVYCGMLINKRLNFIGLIKALGLSDFKIAKQFFILLMIIFLFSFIMGNVFSIFLTSHFSHLAFTLFDYKLNIGFNWIAQLLFGILTIFTVLINAVFLYRRIKKISIAMVLTQKE